MPSDGWISLPGTDGVTVHVRAQWRGVEVSITDLYVHSSDGVTPASMRCISISRLQAELNLASRPGSAFSDVPTVSAIFHAARSEGADTPEPTLAELRARQPIARKPEPRPRLVRPPRGNDHDPDPFYRLVALAYSEYAPQTPAPAKAIAAEAGVPHTTAQRWIAEARSRGFLSPARKGKAG
jgi:hypothetical protein